MYRWYNESAECHVYLEDYDYRNPSSLAECKWSTRGWTLQELLAPGCCVFFTSTWDVIGHRHHAYFQGCACRGLDRDLVDDLVDITKIDRNYLKGAEPRRVSVAQRISWAALRTTTRIEDRAYSILGLFDVNMPLLYGEGPKAFKRLQEEIIRTDPDTSIFCFQELVQLEWGLFAIAQRYHEGTCARCLPIADSPEDFLDYQNVSKGHINSHEPFSVTNKGLCMLTPAYMQPHVIWDQEYRAHAIPLACRRNRQLGKAMYMIVWESGSPRDHIDADFFGVQSSAEKPPLSNMARLLDHAFEGDKHEYRKWEVQGPRMFFISR